MANRDQESDYGIVRRKICFIALIMAITGATTVAFVLMSQHKSSAAKQKAAEATLGEPETTDVSLPALTVDPNVKYEVLKMVPHDPTSFTEGLSYGKDGTIFESTGLNGESKVLRIDPSTFEVDRSIDVPGQYFGEGSTYFTDSNGNARLIHITWKSQKGFIYDAVTLSKLQEFNYTTTPTKHEGWGITYDEQNKEFIVSDGSQYIYFWDRDTFTEKRRITVTRISGQEQKNVNELELVSGLICCNIWFSDMIICVDPATGDSVKEIDFSGLWPLDERKATGAQVLNGIANGGDHILITGKYWDRMYKVKLLDW